MLSPPKYPSAANVGAVVRDFSKDTPRYVAPSEGDGVVHDLIPFGITCGVSFGQWLERRCPRSTAIC